MRSILALLVAALLASAALAAAAGGNNGEAAAVPPSVIDQLEKVVPRWMGNATEATVAFQETAKSYGMFLNQAVVSRNGLDRDASGQPAPQPAALMVFLSRIYCRWCRRRS